MSQPVEWNPTSGTLTIGILDGYHLAQGSARAGSSRYPAVQVTLLGAIAFSEYWAFSGGGGSFDSKLLIVPSP